MIEVAERERSRPNIRYQIRDVMSLTPERDGRFDLVLARDLDDVDAALPGEQDSVEVSDERGVVAWSLRLAD
jgi:hypothetical protein